MQEKSLLRKITVLCCIGFFMALGLANPVLAQVPGPFALLERGAGEAGHHELCPGGNHR